MSALGDAPVWSKQWSKTHQAAYWHNRLTNKTSWTEPPEAVVASLQGAQAEEGGGPPPSKKRAVESTAGGGGAAGSSASASSRARPKVGIIVPFRDLHAEQKRQQHLDRFVPEMSAFLEAAGSPFGIYIVEQSNDGRKFNRGKLLNIGFELALKDGCQIFVLHDVDLIPSAELARWYTSIPDQPVHIARVWNRYNDNPKYFGGIVAFSEQHYRKINGFPNNFWGWGGEDDEMYRRVTELGLVPSAPTEGSIVDLEDMTLTDKLTLLKSNSKWKCMNKTEVLAEHGEWASNGLSTLSYAEQQRVKLGDHGMRITVDVRENGHWTDLVCKLGDAQFDKSVDALKAAFASSCKKAPSAK